MAGRRSLAKVGLMSTMRRRPAGRVTFLVTLALVAIVVPSPTAQAAAGDMTFVGHGWGHGRGMGQYGALGYAVNFGWSSAQILDHFYGGTVASTAGNPEMTVELLGLTGRDTIVTGSGLAINRALVGPAALIRRTAAGTFQVYTAPGCGGPWKARAGLLGSGLTISTSGSQAVLGNLVRVCEAKGERAYRGSLTVVNNGGTQRTINHLPSESYLRGVVPHESPASWGSLGGGKGMQALRAQAVAARTYALASNRIINVAHTCDTTACQVYLGAGFKTGTSLASLENSLTDTAISGTAGVVRRRGGALIPTEFSSSTGGFTAGGAFPAVVDAGDSVVQNPRHNWTTTLPLSVVAARLGTGTIRTIAVTASNGLGENGGRATNVRVVTTAGVVKDFSGNAVRGALGLNSGWFTISGFTPAEAQSVVRALYQDLLGRPADSAGLAGWTGLLGRGVSQSALVASLTKSNEYVQRRVHNAYLDKDVLNRPVDAVGLAAWTRQILAGGVAVDDVQRQLYYSQEFYVRAGATPGGFVANLYTSILGRGASSAEVAAWALQVNQLGRARVADAIWFSMEAAMHRAGGYYELFLQRAADPGGLTTWARVLLAKGDGAVRVGMAGSGEYRLLAVKRFV
jgi:SpoIID/LytB domain protein